MNEGTKQTMAADQRRGRLLLTSASDGFNYMKPLTQDNILTLTTMNEIATQLGRIDKQIKGFQS